MAQSIVFELQQLATNKSNDVADLLRKALLVATKLKMEEFRQWINYELHGYPMTAMVPAYRKLHCTLKVLNPYRGLIPFVLPADIAEMLCNIDYRGPVSSIIGILNRQSEGDRSQPTMPFTQQQKITLMENMDGFPMEPFRFTSENQLEMILDSARTTILEWALRLEQEGIVGDGLSFSEQEKNRAATHQITIQNFQGIIGDVTGSTVTQQLEMSIRKQDLDSLEHFLMSNGIEGKDIAELKKAIHSDPQPKNSKTLGAKVSAWVGDMVGKAANGTWDVGVAVAGELLVKAIAAYYGIGG